MGIDKIRNFFLHAKAWQIFALLFAIPVVGVVVQMMGATRLSMALMALYAVAGIGWYWSLGSFCSSALKPPQQPAIGLFHAAAFYPLFYMLAFFWFFVTTKKLQPEIFFPLHLLAMICMLYLLFFVAKTLTVVETKRPAEFSDYAGSLVLLWFYPVGIWIIQPKVNKLASSSDRECLDKKLD